MITHSKVELVQLSKNRFTPSVPIVYQLNGYPLTTVNPGFVTDKTSWPAILKALLGWTPKVKRWLKDERYTPAAILHDALLVDGSFSKAEIDWLYMAALKEAGVPSFEAHLFFLAVRSKRNPRI
jgi:hypothetical protein